VDTGKIKNVYLLGIGGIGMSALARYFKYTGKNVAGYDKTPTPLTEALSAEGIDVHYQDDPGLLPSYITAGAIKEESLIIITPAIPKDHKELLFIREKEFNILKRSEVLGMLTRNSYTVAVAGTHGKTTTSSIIAHLFKSAGVDCTAFLGGIAVNYQSNLILGKRNDTDNTVIVAEADEFDRSFLTLHPDLAVITSMDADHLDIYGDKSHLEESYNLFAEQVKENGTLFYKAGLPLKKQSGHRISYSINTAADITGMNISVKDNRYYFDLKYKGNEYSGFSLGIPGRHNVENAVAAIAVAFEMKIPVEKIKSGLLSYRGVKRRFEFHISTQNCTYIDDYAHHPEELRAAISSVKELYPGKKITGIFQPHLYSRTRDFADGFAQSLSLLDTLVLLDIYPARELPIEGVTSAIIYDKVTIKDKTICKKEELMGLMEHITPEVLITLGAGDIDQFVYPIRDLLLKRATTQIK
jgi:UDP-N-acetylmuramate--alanine ligase